MDHSIYNDLEQQELDRRLDDFINDTSGRYLTKSKYNTRQSTSNMSTLPRNGVNGDVCNSLIALSQRVLTSRSQIQTPIPTDGVLTLTETPGALLTGMRTENTL